MESDIDAAARFEVNQFMFECAGSIIGLSLTDHQKHTLFHRFKKVLEDAEYKIKQARESALDTHANAAVLKMCHEARMMNGIVDYSDPKAVGVVRKVMSPFLYTLDGAVVHNGDWVWHGGSKWLVSEGKIPVARALQSCGVFCGYRDIGANECYSTREAAEAAKEVKA